MKSWKWMLSLIAILSITMAAAAQQGQRPAGQGRPERTPEEIAERAKIAKEAIPLTAQAIAKFLELDKAAAKKFKAAYVKDMAEAAERNVAARALEGQARMDAYRANSEATQAAIKACLTEDQMTKAAPLIGTSRYNYNPLDRSIQSLLRAKVAKAKVRKAIPVLVAYTVERSKLFGTSRGAYRSEADITAARAKSDALRAKLIKDLTPIVGAEAAAAMQSSRTRGGTGGTGSYTRGGTGGTGSYTRGTGTGTTR